MRGRVFLKKLKKTVSFIVTHEGDCVNCLHDFQVETGLKDHDETSGYKMGRFDPGKRGMAEG